MTKGPFPRVGIICAAGFAQAEALSRLLKKIDSALYGSDSDVDLIDRWRIVGELTLLLLRGYLSRLDVLLLRLLRRRLQLEANRGSCRLAVLPPVNEEERGEAGRSICGSANTP